MMSSVIQLLWRHSDVVAAVLVLGFALGTGLLYEHGSEVNSPLRADAGRYFRAAFNLRTFGVHSLDRPRWDKAPESRTDLSLGYPLFLASHIGPAKTRDDFVRSVLFSQLLLFATTAMFTFLLARLSLPLRWAMLAGLLSALSPHLIAMHGYVLTETLFTFLTVLGAFLLAVSLRRRSYILALAASILISLSAHVRAVNYALVVFLAPLLLLTTSSRDRVTRTPIRLRQLGAFVVGCLLVAGLHREFVRLTVTHEPSLFRHDSVQSQPVRPAPRRYVVFHGPLPYLRKAVRPPGFFVNGESHIGFRQRESQKEWARSDDGFLENPGTYLGWTLARFYYMWNWDNAYNGGVNIYPMIRSGFEEDAMIGLIHGGMRALHWPLFLLAIMAPVLLVLRWRNGSLSDRERLLWVPVLGFLYFLLVLSVLGAWLPRYTIPARPFSYILASASLWWAWEWVRQPTTGRRSRQPQTRRGRERVKSKASQRCATYHPQSRPIATQRIGALDGIRVIVDRG